MIRSLMSNDLSPSKVCHIINETQVAVDSEISKKENEKKEEYFPCKLK